MWIDLKTQPYQNETIWKHIRETRALNTAYSYQIISEHGFHFVF